MLDVDGVDGAAAFQTQFNAIFVALDDGAVQRSVSVAVPHVAQVLVVVEIDFQQLLVPFRGRDVHRRFSRGVLLL